jgi:hypothetical protein
MKKVKYHAYKIKVSKNGSEVSFPQFQYAPFASDKDAIAKAQELGCNYVQRHDMNGCKTIFQSALIPLCCDGGLPTQAKESAKEKAIYLAMKEPSWNADYFDCNVDGVMYRVTRNKNGEYFAQEHTRFTGWTYVEV